MLKYKNAQLPVAERVADLLECMSIEEKMAQLFSQWLYLSEDGNHRPREMEFSLNEATHINEVLKHGLGQITRPLGTHVVDPEQGVNALNALQKFLVENTRLGIPAMPHEECLVGLLAKEGTLFPSSLNYGSTWHPELIQEVGKVIGDEVRAVGGKQGLAPVLDISRDVRWGRTEETFAEDPYLTGVLATEFVKGLQGEKRDVYATLKHYVGHSFSEGARNHAPVHLGFKELNDTFMLPFEMAVKLGNAASVMPAYHDIDNEPCHSSQYLLTDVLRDQWGFDGLVVADYAGVDLLHSHHAIAADRAHAAALAFNAGLDVELPDNTCTAFLPEALKRGLITMEKIDEIVGRVLKAKFELGLFENPYVQYVAGSLGKSETKEVAYRVAKESITLLENRNALPLNKDQRVAIIGPTANDQLALLSGYSFPVHLIISNEQDTAKVAPTFYEELAKRFSQVGFAQGCHILTERKNSGMVFPGDVDEAINQEKVSPVSQDASLIKEAVALAQKSDVAIVFAGDLAGLFQTGTVGEGSDADSLSLPGVQEQLLREIIATGTPTILVMSGGRPYCLNGLEDELAGWLMTWQPGYFGGRALADILLGDCSPSGRLTLSIPKNVGAVPYYYNHKLKSSGTPIAFQFGSKYNFGYGLTYSHFEYSDFSIKNKHLDADGTIEVSVNITNTGKYKASEVVQLYVRDALASVVRPVKELKGFHKVNLQPKQSVRVNFRLPVDMLNLTNMLHQRVVEAGDFDIMIGKSSSQIEFKETVNVATSKVLPKYWRMICESSNEPVMKMYQAFAEA